MAKDEFEYVWKDRKRTFLGLPWSFTVYYLTETKLICRTGFLNITEDEIDLYKITDKRLKQTFGQKLVSCGTVHICSRDVTLPEFDMIVKNPREVMNLLDKYVNQARDKYGTRGRDLYGAPSMHPHHDDDNDNDDDDNDNDNN